MTKAGLILFLIFGSVPVFSQSLTPLTVEKIMQDPTWIGSSPSNPQWSADAKTLYFSWNPDKAGADSLYAILMDQQLPQKVPVEQIPHIVFSAVALYNRAGSAYTYSSAGDIYLKDAVSGRETQITQTNEIETAEGFSFNETKVVYQRYHNLYGWDRSSGETLQLTDFRKGEDPALTEKTKKMNSQEEWLQEDQLHLMDVLRERKQKKDAADAYAKKLKPNRGPKPIYTGNSVVQDMQISSSGRFISYILFTDTTHTQHTIIPDYVTETGFTTDIPGRTKVGTPQGNSALYILDRVQDTVITVNTSEIPGIRDLPDYLFDYPRLLEKKKQKNALRSINITKVSWAPAGDYAVVDIEARDNKDRWLMKLEGATGRLLLLNRQHDDAWIGGPGISSEYTGWINDHIFWFQSEVTGYSHLYTVDVHSGKVTALTSGNYEVQDCRLSPDYKYFYITTNEIHAGEKQLYRLPVSGGAMARLTWMPGANQTLLSPDGKHLAIMHSYTNQPWELFVQKIKPGSKGVQITRKAKSELFNSYAWRDPELVYVPASDGKQVPARLYRPAKPHPSGAAVIFVHGAGYLQNAHKWWSSYFREYMFHNLLADNGYYVLDMDYRASAGYGRDWRTAIYRHMGGRDLQDHLDGAKYLVEKLGVNPKNIGIYGGSYGGFITLMALFTAPGTFAAGAALRPVTDWAHYNQGYTSNILNTPAEDSLAYHKSSPIYFAGGLQDQLLICHGVIDVNVHFQDVVRLNQRLIELGKDNWQVALYPVEDHGFKEPSSWVDEYKRIYQLFERVLKNR